MKANFSRIFQFSRAKMKHLHFKFAPFFAREKNAKLAFPRNVFHACEKSQNFGPKFAVIRKRKFFRARVKNFPANFLKPIFDHFLPLGRAFSAPKF